MAGKRDRLVNFIRSKGVEVNIGKNKARGNKGFFKVDDNKFRIDVAKGLDDDEILRVLVHEFAHYIHYSYDKKMKYIDFILPDITPEITEELIKLTVNDIDKHNASRLFDIKKTIKQDIALLSDKIKKSYPDFQLSKPYNLAESYIKHTKYRYLLKYDSVKVKEYFSCKCYSINEIDKYELPEEMRLYLKIKSKQRYLKRVSGKINYLNRYYNNLSELFARSIVGYIFENTKFLNIAPKIFMRYNNVVDKKIIPLLNELLCVMNVDKMYNIK